VLLAVDGGLAHPQAWAALLLALAVALPISAAANALRRRFAFDLLPARRERAAAAESGEEPDPLAAKLAAAPRPLLGPDEAERWRSALLEAPGASPGSTTRR
jgi:hypothetical protein